MLDNERSSLTLSAFELTPKKLLRKIKQYTKDYPGPEMDWICGEEMTLRHIAEQDASQLESELFESDRLSDNDIATVLESKEFPDFFIESLFSLDGLYVAGFIGEAAVRVYIHSLLRTLWPKESARNSKTWLAFERKATAILLKTLRPVSGYPYRFDAANALKEAGMEEELHQLFHDWESWIGS